MVYSDYLIEKTQVQQQAIKEEKQDKPKQEKIKQEKKRLSFKEQKEWETIAADIEKVEQQIMDTEDGIATAGADFTKLQELTQKLDELNATYEHLIERWSYLDEIANG